MSSSIESLLVAREQHDRHGGELLRDRRDVEDRRGRDRRSRLEVRHAVAALVDDATVAADAERAPGRVRSAPGVEHAVDGTCGRVGARCLSCDSGGQCERARGALSRAAGDGSCEEYQNEIHSTQGEEFGEAAVESTRFASLGCVFIKPTHPRRGSHCHDPVGRSKRVKV